MNTNPDLLNIKLITYSPNNNNRDLAARASRPGTPDLSEESDIDHAALRSLCEEVRAILHSLTAQEQHVITARFGLDNSCESRTLEDVSHQLGVTRERVRQIECRALQKLRQTARVTGLIHKLSC